MLDINFYIAFHGLIQELERERERERENGRPMS